ncbi:unnamed protein product, partial [Prorocentrum cordatum]
GGVSVEERRNNALYHLSPEGWWDSVFDPPLEERRAPARHAGPARLHGLRRRGRRRTEPRAAASRVRGLPRAARARRRAAAAAARASGAGGVLPAAAADASALWLLAGGRAFEARVALRAAAARGHASGRLSARLAAACGTSRAAARRARGRPVGAARGAAAPRECAGLPSLARAGDNVLRVRRAVNALRRLGFAGDSTLVVQAKKDLQAAEAEEQSRRTPDDMLRRSLDRLTQKTKEVDVLKDSVAETEGKLDAERKALVTATSEPAAIQHEVNLARAAVLASTGAPAAAPNRQLSDSVQRLVAVVVSCATPPNGAGIGYLLWSCYDLQQQRLETARRAPRWARRKAFTISTCTANGWPRLKDYLQDGAGGSLLAASQEVRLSGDARLQAIYRGVEKEFVPLFQPADAYAHAGRGLLDQVVYFIAAVFAQPQWMRVIALRAAASGLDILAMRKRRNMLRRVQKTGQLACRFAKAAVPSALMYGAAILAFKNLQWAASSAIYVRTDLGDALGLRSFPPSSPRADMFAVAQLLRVALLPIKG